MRRARSGWVGLASAVGLLASGGPDAAGRAPEPAAQPAGAESAAPYRFVERYAVPKENPTRRARGAIGFYRVAFKQTIQIVTDKPRGAPTREELVRQIVYAERPAEINPLDASQVVGLVRRYETVRMTPDPRPRPSEPWPMEGLTIWYHARTGEFPKILSLTPGRRLRDEDYRNAANQIAVTDLPAVLPALPVRPGDEFRVLNEGVVALTRAEGGEVTGKFVEVRDDPKASKRIAVFELSGRVTTESGGDLGLRARVEFAFNPPPRVGPTGAAPKKDEPIEVVGGIVKLSMAQSETSGATRPDDHARRSTKRQLVLERQLAPEGPAPEVPDPLPAETPENSWLTHADPKGQFQFRHPQGLQTSPAEVADAVFLAGAGPDGEERGVRLFFLPRATLKPDDVFQKIFEGVRAARKGRAEPGAYQTLNWPGLRVLRKESAIRPEGEPGEGRRLWLTAYLIQFPREASLIVEATTAEERPTAFREEVEATLKTFEVGPPKGR